MKLVAIVDTETSGLDPQTSQVVEVACILYSLELAMPLASFASILPTVKNEAAAVNGIPQQLLDDAPILSWQRQLNELTEASDAILAHNAEFDYGFLRLDIWVPKPWVCTMRHVKWPCPSSSAALTNVALAHGVPVIAAHRALTDCDIIARLLTRVSELGVPLPALIEEASRPQGIWQALVAYHDRDRARAAGFAPAYKDSKFEGWFLRSATPPQTDFPTKYVGMSEPIETRLS